MQWRGQRASAGTWGTVVLLHNWGFCRGHRPGLAAETGTGGGKTLDWTLDEAISPKAWRKFVGPFVIAQKGGQASRGGATGVPSIGDELLIRFASASISLLHKILSEGLPQRTIMQAPPLPPPNLSTGLFDGGRRVSSQVPLQ